MKVAILGAGIAGLGTAIALRQRGVRVSVHERHKAPTTIGAGVVLWPNATWVLDQLGIGGAIAAVSGRPAVMRRMSRTGEPLGAIDLGLIEQRMGWPCRSILRVDLHRLLTARLATLGVAVRHGEAVAHVDTDPDGRAAVRLNGGATIRADVVLGADGRMASRARAFVVGNPAPVFQGLVNWVGVFEGDRDVLHRHEIVDCWGVGERFGIVPVSPGRAYWAGGAACNAPGTRDPDAAHAELTARFDTWPAPVPAMIAAAPRARIGTIYVHDHDPVRPWHRGNLLLIGDAAHAPLPTSGQGAAQALEDAWHLANVLSAGPADLDAAFTAFTARRFDKTTSITMAGRAMAASLFDRDPARCAARDADSQAMDFAALAVGMAAGWSRGLPLGGVRRGQGL